MTPTEFYSLRTGLDTTKDTMFFCREQKKKNEKLPFCGASLHILWALLWNICIYSGEILRVVV